MVVEEVSANQHQRVSTFLAGGAVIDGASSMAESRAVVTVSPSNVSKCAWTSNSPSDPGDT